MNDLYHLGYGGVVPEGFLSLLAHYVEVFSYFILVQINKSGTVKNLFSPPRACLSVSSFSLFACLLIKTTTSIISLHII